ncbi:carbohydrate ABC transporter permease [Aquibacillus albus]|uniref:Raffinose/stachyose/melibiose transport system permease protein n=1 Tax=Aquibacillus albus TaxID=1168171 RepID=A0ABS2MXH9_9BACI|nr:carbohydrate ABC transporter permease [Aquibacillus albus]MBM7570587.1 raffinose/stachyose/melibiose transport system permease protein [Aquibacillus albus]
MKKQPARVLFYIFIITFGLVWLIPVFFLTITALKSNGDLFSNPLYALPSKYHFENFIEAFNEGNMIVYMRNSAFISIIKVPLGILVAALAAFGLTRLSFKWEKPFYIFFILGMTIPFQACLVPLVIMLTKANLMNTYVGLIFIYIGFGIPFAMLILTGFFKGIPRELDDAARIDGCSDLGLFFRIILPVAKPAIATLIIMDFLATWNEFLLAQIFISSDNLKTVTTGIMSFTGEYSTDYPLMMSGVLLSVLPVLLVYIIFQKHFVKGLGGAVKG